MSFSSFSKNRLCCLLCSLSQPCVFLFWYASDWALASRLPSKYFKHFPFSRFYTTEYKLFKFSCLLKISALEPLFSLKDCPLSYPSPSRPLTKFLKLLPPHFLTFYLVLEESKFTKTSINHFSTDWKPFDGFALPPRK